MVLLRPKRLGMLIPSSNTVVEPQTAKLLPADGSVTAHVSRIGVVTISADDASLRQFERDSMLAAAWLLADAEVDLILWNGTAAGWLGFERDIALTHVITAHTGIPATTATMALNDALRRHGARRIGLVTPYVAELEARIIQNYAMIGIEITSAVRLNLTHNTDYAAIPPDEIAAMAHEVAREPVDAILILCTNLAGATVAAPLERQLGIPVLDSVRVAIEHSLGLLHKTGS
ncbi:maleate isomerase [Rhizobium sp. SG_E_25_P2]|uniref:maleate cis-trans isomerase family protein n=1 Tax=Rhizobium sp. SG_E_25_P2 TaxID=2879942 RepID=UPI002473FA49|nr:aspartate/glutamate racemase family protein [Rhizobium sp. SG_E_25_P2]MDH6268156.1 maleate isomerase [Rhizobium sp. SG_E_25_P2]